MSVLPTVCSIFCFFFAWIGNKYFSDKMGGISDDGSSMQMSETDKKKSIN